MKKSNAEAKFFCESCGSEVPSKAKVCPVCGKFFASVRCPKCGRTGASEEFIKGCPTCGYAMRPEDLYGEDYDPDKYGGSSGTKSGNKIAKGKKSTSGSDSALPFWIYVIPLSILAVLIVILYSCF